MLNFNADCFRRLSVVVDRGGGDAMNQPPLPPIMHNIDMPCLKQRAHINGTTICMSRLKQSAPHQWKYGQYINIDGDTPTELSVTK